ncbi:MerR family transcriptional regulator [Magnetospirillum sp. SS-4]|uniref:MerR family transcriptional regulator n=1 Tax=Magnetospirillum sp. SS-4 TaxID=2681465 RepID=UPI001380C8D4|nr:MerR family transcriptional regulator [Magnetospirillum sp. SS-4]CAA7621728.1 Transcriptional regulator [Magnetospirillum sp. SS-4]
MTGEDGELSLVRRNGKSEAAFRTISEVADDLDVPQHVLRFWEGKFPQVKPLKRGGGRRYYRPDDIVLLRRIRDLLYSEGYTIKGVQKLLKDGAAATQPPIGASPARIACEPELGLDIHDPDPLESPDPPLPSGDETNSVAVEAAEVHVASVVPSGDIRHELRKLLAELEQLRQLLQPC